MAYQSAPVPVTDNSGSLTIDAVSLPLPTGASTEATLAAQSAKLPATLGTKTAANSLPVTLATDGQFVTSTGSVTETAPATDTASSGLNGRLQRIAQRLTSLIALVPAALVSGRFDVNLGAAPATVTTAGVAAHDAAVSGNPSRIAGRARSADVTAVSADDTTDLITDLVGKQIILPYAIPENSLAGVTADITGTSNTSVIAAQAAGVRIFVTQLVVQNSHATVNTWVNIKDGTTTVYTVYAPALGGGVSVTLPVPLRGTAATALQAACETTGSNVRVSASGYKGV